ncbi:MAG: sigma 54-interacting transcriptional regulator, partial [bacterium]
MEEQEKKTWDLERQVFQLKTLLEIAQALSRCRTQEEVYAQILATIAGAFGARHALALAQENGQWRCMATHGISQAVNSEIENHLDHDFDTATARRQQEILSELTDHRPNDDLSFSLWEHLHVKNQIVGGFYFGKKILIEPYSRDDERLLRAVCSYAANALENIDLYEELNAAKEKLTVENLTLRQQVRHDDASKKIIGSSPAIKKILENIQSFGRSDASVLIFGETGTGKELVARAIHYAS